MFPTVTNQEIYNKAIGNYPFALEFVPGCHLDMCDKAGDTYPSTIKFVPECHKTQKMCHRAVNKCFFVIGYIPDKYVT